MRLLATYILYLLILFMAMGLLGLLAYIRFFPNEKRIDSLLFCKAILLGTAITILFTNIFSNFGLNIRQVIYLLAGVVLVLILLSWRNLKKLHIEIKDIVGIGLFAGISVIGTISIFLPSILGNSYVFIGDTYTYISISEYLQTHGFQPFLSADNFNYFPYLSQTFIYQYGKFRMGAIWFLAFIQNIFSKDAISIFPVAVSWGLILCSSSLYLFIHKYITNNLTGFIYLLIFNILPNPVFSSALTGFLPQTFGVAGFLICVYLGEKLLDADFSYVLLFSIFLSFLTSVYSELVPFTIIIVLALCLIQFVSRWKYQKSRIDMKGLFKRFLLVVVGWLVFSNLELERFISSISKQLNAVVGWHIELVPFKWLSYALGYRGSGIEWPPVPLETQEILCGLIFLILIGYLVINYRSNPIPLAFSVILLVFVVFLIYFGLFINDPWTKRLGQTWSLYKLIQWFYCGVFLIQMFAIEGLASRIFKKLKYIPVLAFLVLIASIYIPQQIQTAKEINKVYASVFDSPSPLTDLKKLNQELKKINPENVKTIVLISEKSYLWPQMVYTYFLRDHKIVGNWKDIAYFPISLRNFDPELTVEESICLLVERRSSENRYTMLKELPADTALVECTPDLVKLR